MRISDWSSDVCSSDLQYLPLFSYELVLAVASSNPLAKHRFIDPGQLADQILITYPVERQRLDVFTAFLDPADVEPAGLRKAELTPIIAQLVAGQRGVAALPNWALTEYLAQGWLDRKSVVYGKSVSVRVVLGGRPIIKNKINRQHEL